MEGQRYIHEYSNLEIIKESSCRCDKSKQLYGKNYDERKKIRNGPAQIHFLQNV